MIKHESASQSWMNVIWMALNFDENTHGEDRLQPTSRGTGLPSPIFDCCCALLCWPIRRARDCSVSSVRPERLLIGCQWHHPCSRTLKSEHCSVHSTARRKLTLHRTNSLPPWAWFFTFIQCDFIIKTSSIGSCLCQSDNSLLATPVGWLTLLYIIMLRA